ncbi:MAG: hypothetical protein HOL85_10925 [Rhodospirillaceae bacterium]|jgi:hypothetical protein|nr:hypothetical protein [Rhodospirillaceae bacterium]
MYLYLPIEEASREFDSRLLIARYALDHGFEVVVGQQWLLQSNAMKLPPGISLLKGNNRRQRPAERDARAGGHLIASLEEGALGLTDEREIVRLWLRRAHLLEPSIVAPLTRISNYLHGDQRDQDAIRLLRRVILIEPGHPRLQFILAECQSRSGQRHRASNSSRRALLALPQMRGAAFLHGTLKHQLGRSFEDSS